LKAVFASEMKSSNASKAPELAALQESALEVFYLASLSPLKGIVSEFRSKIKKVYFLARLALLFPFLSFFRLLMRATGPIPRESAPGCR